MGDSNKAVFLSYASQDAVAAKRICDALRGASIEVWFDQSELRGVDVWGHKIRKQIHDCALFISIISAHTHRGSIRQDESGLLFINPGETSGWTFRKPSVAILETSPISARLVALPEMAPVPADE